jgi:hypothetical protein
LGVSIIPRGGVLVVDTDKTSGSTMGFQEQGAVEDTALARVVRDGGELSRTGW